LKTFTSFFFLDSKYRLLGGGRKESLSPIFRGGWGAEPPLKILFVEADHPPPHTHTRPYKLQMYLCFYSKHPPFVGTGGIWSTPAKIEALLEIIFVVVQLNMISESKVSSSKPNGSN